MRDDVVGTAAGQQYAAAYAAHYGTKNLPEALSRYAALLGAHPDAPEAEYTRSQIQNIVKTVVPRHAFSEALVSLASAHLALRDLPDHGVGPIVSPAEWASAAPAPAPGTGSPGVPLGHPDH